MFKTLTFNLMLLEIVLSDEMQLLDNQSSLVSPSNLASEVTEDENSKQTNEITALPLNIARILGDGELPTKSYFKKLNSPEVISKFFEQYNLGLTNENNKLNITELITKNEFPVETHSVQTEDGYELTMFRIPGKGPAVFLMHGLCLSADDWVLNGPESALAYLLSKDGYDVWMGNARGTRHSRKHVTLKPDQAEFWNFSWHEIGLYDLPAMIDYTLYITGSDQVKYVGHSQGTTSFFVMTSERPEYNEKINIMIALAPVAFMSRLISPIIRLFVPDITELGEVAKILGVYEFLADVSVIRLLAIFLCGDGPIEAILCNNILFLIGGFDYDQMTVKNLPLVFSHIPAGASTNQLVHYGQEILSGQFRGFDYGEDENNKLYGSPDPPEYLLENVMAPVALFYSENDWLSNSTDVKLLYGKLRNVVDFYDIPWKKFGHFDYLYAKDFKTLVYERLENVLSSF